MILRFCYWHIVTYEYTIRYSLRTRNKGVQMPIFSSRQRLRLRVRTVKLYTQILMQSPRACKPSSRLTDTHWNLKASAVHSVRSLTDPSWLQSRHARQAESQHPEHCMSKLWGRKSDEVQQIAGDDVCQLHEEYIWTHQRSPYCSVGATYTVAKAPDLPSVFRTTQGSESRGLVPSDFSAVRGQIYFCCQMQNCPNTHVSLRFIGISLNWEKGWCTRGNTEGFCLSPQTSYLKIYNVIPGSSEGEICAQGTTTYPRWFSMASWSFLQCEFDLCAQEKSVKFSF